MRSLVWLDPGLESQNAGDEVISEAIGAIDASVGMARRISTHRHPRLRDLRALAAAEIVVIGGSNILASHMERHRQWLVTPAVAASVWGKCVFVGVGWWQYQRPPCRYSKWLIKGIADQGALHAARDGYTAQRLRDMGLRTAMTSCPTMWGLPRELPQSRSTTALVTVTNYYRDKVVDSCWLSAVSSRYQRVVAVGMEAGDFNYLESIGFLEIPNVAYAGTGLGTLDRALEDEVEFVGTRLHAGIRSLGAGRRSLILGVDNRAKEIAVGTGLPVVPRIDLAGIRQWIEGPSASTLTLPTEAIEGWLEWFDQAIRRDGQPDLNVVSGSRG
jgi:hypothetical protein